ncbi:MAG: GNAT family N-acetyltransferase [Ruminococcus sp.]|jgi:ribosomal protein S18 acetylase RimI-like enzyme|nr:GNAT family N-acetyltransferase [Ruminococcus sp.]
MDKKTVYEIYSESFPDLLAGYDTFFSRLGLDNNASKITFFEDKAFAVYQNYALLLLCVGKDYRHLGIGTRLLKIVEKEIFREHEKVVLGHSDTHYLYPGVYGENAVSFFKKLGYEYSWNAYDMLLDVDNNVWENAPGYDGGDFEFRYRKDDETRAVKIAGDEIDGWGDAYASANRCLVAVKKKSGEIAGAIIIDEDNLYNLSLPDAGGFGCVGVRERYRKFGLGMRLCKEALKILSEMGIKRCFIGYTDLVSWYAKLGAAPIAKYAMGEKSYS